MHCAQCLSEVFTSGHETPTGEILCGPCYFALWGPRANGAGSPTSGAPGRGGRTVRARSDPGPARFLEPVPAEQRGSLAPLSLS